MVSVGCPAPLLVEASVLDSWSCVGSGGFGKVYRVRHKRLCCEVAIKLLHCDDDGSLLLRELDLMRQSNSPHVIQVLGVFRGVPPAGQSVRLGLVMEFMERGCLATLQEQLGGAPPWALVFRLAHHVALGINFLHSLKPPLLHLDLKPSNVLLDGSLKAKLTDFGLAKVYVSTRGSGDDAAEEGTLKYLPPEAFQLNYKPSQSSDIYSLGILLWSIVSWRQPFPHALSSIVRLRIPQGDRPSLEQILKLEVSGLSALTDLMQKCWSPRPTERPDSQACSLLTEELFFLHRHQVHSAVHMVLQILVPLTHLHRVKAGDQDLNSASERLQNIHIHRPVKEENSFRDAPTGKGPVQEVAADSVKTQQIKENEKSLLLSESAKLSSSVKPIGESTHHPSSSRATSSTATSSTATSSTATSSTATSSTSRDTSSKASSSRAASSSSSAKPKGPPPSLSSPKAQYQRQLSNPQSASQRPLPYLNITCSHVTGLQCGNNNVMNIQGLERRRHPSAPSRVDTRKLHKDKPTL